MNSYHSSVGVASLDALYAMRCRSPIQWFDVFEVRPWGTAMLKDLIEKLRFIQEKLIVTQSQLKKYANNKMRDVKFTVGEKVLQKFSPIKGVIQFGKRGKYN